MCVEGGGVEWEAHRMVLFTLCDASLGVGNGGLLGGVV